MVSQFWPKGLARIPPDPNFSRADSSIRAGTSVAASGSNCVVIKSSLYCVNNTHNIWNIVHIHTQLWQRIPDDYAQNIIFNRNNIIQCVCRPWKCKHAKTNNAQRQSTTIQLREREKYRNFNALFLESLNIILLLNFFEWFSLLSSTSNKRNDGVFFKCLCHIFHWN